MQFAQPLWLIAGVIICALLAWQYRRFDLSQSASLARFAAARLLHKLTSSVSAPRRRLKRTLFIAGTGLLFVALARPQSGFEWQETHRKGLELLFAVDTSKSMLSQDVKPNRLTRAKLAVNDLVAKLNGDGTGLIAFAGDAFLQCPVTLDYEAFRESLDALDTNTIPLGGTDIAAAIRESEAVFKTRPTAEKILILITDGEDLGGDGITEAQAAAKNGVKIFTVGVGSATGSLIPLTEGNGGTDFVKDDNGLPVKSHLDEATLKKIAEVTGGTYQPLGPQGEGLTNIYDQGLAQFTRQDLSSHQVRVPLEKFYWVLLAALACFVGEMLIGNRRRIRASKTVPALVKTKRAHGLRPAAAATTFAALLLLVGVASTHASTPQSAEQAYQNGDFAKAQQEYAAAATKQPTKAELQFNTGSAAYKAGDYAQAAADFQQSLKTGQVPLQQGAYYNLGNTQYRLGQKTENENPQDTIKTWEGAVKSYDAALQIAANDTEAKHNRDLVQQRIDQLKKQQEQKKQDQQKQDNKDQKNQSKDQQKDSKDQQGGSKDQKSDAKDNNGGADDQKNGQKDSKPGDKQKRGESQDQKGDDQNKKEDTKSQQADAKQGEPKDKNVDAKQPQPGDGKKDQQQPKQADANSGNSGQPKPVNDGNKPSQGAVQVANGGQPGDAQAAAAADEKREPGQMTREEAKQLLDGLKGDEGKVPAISARGRADVQPDENKPIKDW